MKYEAVFKIITRQRGNRVTERRRRSSIFGVNHDDAMRRSRRIMHDHASDASSIRSGVVILEHLFVLPSHKDVLEGITAHRRAEFGHR